MDFSEIYANEEIKNFEKIARQIKPHPGEIPMIPGLDIYGETIPLHGEVSGDHIIYVDFNKRFDIVNRISQAEAAGNLQIVEKLKKLRHRAGILLSDVSGHSITDSLLNAMLHQSFLIGASYELSLHGDITVDLFETINQRFYQSSSIDKFITMLYGEIRSNGDFRFISAGHPFPVIFSNEFNELVDINAANMISYPPIGTLPSESNVDKALKESIFGFKERYSLNRLNIMGQGDILILFTDGFTEQLEGEFNYAKLYLTDALREIKTASAPEIFRFIKTDFLNRVTTRDDDVTFVVIKKN